MPLGGAELLLGRQHIHLGIGWREAVGPFTINHVLAQAHGDGRDAILGQRVGHGIIIERLSHAGNMGIKMVPEFASDHLLNQDGHLLFFDLVVNGLEVAAGGLGIDRGIDQLDGLAELCLAHAWIRVVVGQEEGAIQPGERVGKTVLHQAGRPDCQWVPCMFRQIKTKFIH